MLAVVVARGGRVESDIDAGHPPERVLHLLRFGGE